MTKVNLKGTVVRHTGSHYFVSPLPLWNPEPVVARGRLRLAGSGSTNPVAVGDIVEYSDGTITAVMPRKNCVVRRSTNLSRQNHIIAANVDCAWLVVTLADPQTKWPFIDRFLVTCRAYDVPVRILLNKMDLYENDENLMALHDLFHSIYEGAGYTVMDLCVNDGRGIERLRQECRSVGLSLFSGVSGVGKSSIIKALDPSLNPKTGGISDKYRQGRHTTTFYEIYPLQGGGFLIDTPGIRGFGIVDIDPEEISNYFPEMLKVSHECRYKPCTHTHEPDCAVIRGVEEGRISYERYSSYLGMLDEEGKYR